MWSQKSQLQECNENGRKEVHNKSRWRLGASERKGLDAFESTIKGMSFGERKVVLLSVVDKKLHNQGM